MKESAQIAYTYAKSLVHKKEVEGDLLQRGHLHIHVPEVRQAVDNLSPS